MAGQVVRTVVGLTLGVAAIMWIGESDWSTLAKVIVFFIVLGVAGMLGPTGTYRQYLREQEQLAAARREKQMEDRS